MLLQFEGRRSKINDRVMPITGKNGFEEEFIMSFQAPVPLKAYLNKSRTPYSIDYFAFCKYDRELFKHK